jgi:N-acetylmuramic acid 6-phosphate (MurNAc-6-P) etherase
VGVGEDGRAALLGDETTPTASVTLSPQDFVVLAGGRRAPESTEPLIEGDEELGHRLLHSLTVTP